MKTTKNNPLPVRDFKKKNISTSTNTANNNQPLDKLTNLKSKITQQKQIMRQSGRRFRQQSARSSQSTITNISEKLFQQSPINHKTETKTSPVKKTTTQISIMTITQPKQQISLKQLGQISTYNSTSMAASRIFEKQVETQKNKNTELKTFLKELGLQKFYEQIEALGYDDLETVVEIGTEELNHMMMRAHQQDKLIAALKKIRANMGLDETKDNPSTLSTKSAIPRKRFHTQSALTTNPSTPSRQIQKVNQKQKFSPNKNSFSSKSFLYTVGSNFWSIESQVRRACSSCFKVSQQLTKQGDCFYCPQCFKWVADDCMSVSLSSSMIRNYK